MGNGGPGFPIGGNEVKKSIQVWAIVLLLTLILPLPGVYSSNLKGVNSPLKFNHNGRGDLNQNISDLAEGSLLGFPGSRIGSNSGGGFYTAPQMSNSGDVNGDGFDDLVIGLPSYNHDGVDGGKIYVYFGSGSLDIGLNVSDTDASFIGEDPDGMAGCSVEIVGDVNDDGYDDILIGDYNINSYWGKVYLILGKPTQNWAKDVSLSNADATFVPSSAIRLGSTVAGAGDVNNDGYDDILIGAPYQDGEAFLFLGKSNIWSQNTPINTADASFVRETGQGQRVGNNMASAGDVNGDGYGDFLIGAPYGSQGMGVPDRGEIYLILGKSSGWSYGTSLSNADASFVEEDTQYLDYIGNGLAGGGDVNGDGYDDILIGANSWDSPGMDFDGKFYLILGKETGLSMDTSLSNADASYLGEDDRDSLGLDIDFLEDIDGDGLDEIVVCSNQFDYQGENRGKVYIINGRTSGWPTNANISIADSTIVGEFPGDRFGTALEIQGDINGDGMEDIIVGARNNDEGGNGGGKIYFVTGMLNYEPTRVDTFEIYTEPYSNPSRTFDIGQTLYLELTGEDGNATHQDLATINITYQSSPIGLSKIRLRETGLNTGVYRGQFIIPPRSIYFDVTNIYPKAGPSFDIDIVIDYPFRPTTVGSVTVYEDEGLTTTTEILDYGETAYFAITGDDANPLLRDKAFLNLSSDNNLSFSPLIVCRETGINTGLYVGNLNISTSMLWFENITATSVRNPLKSDIFKVHTPVQIRPFQDNKTAYEDIEYREAYWNFGWVTNPTWTLRTDMDWLQFDQGTKELYGTPDNTEVGLTTVELNLTDTEGHFSSHKFRIFVSNTNPNLFGTDITEINQGEYYETDYKCDDDGQGNVTYYLSSNAEWLTMDSHSGILKGSPTNEDVGTVTVTVSVHDGNEGWDSRQFDIKVLDVNDPPVIITNDTMSVYQDDPFLRNYQALEIDSGDEIKWKLHTDAGFLSIDQEMGTLSGVPGYMDVGSYFVNVSVWDLSDEFDFHNFTLEVLNVNDRPAWVDFPENINIVHGKTYLFDVNATDYDGDTTYYSVSSAPDSDITIDEDTGQINWTADIHIFDKAPFKLEVIVSAWDGLAFTNRTFTITVLASEPPEVELIGPGDGEKGASTGAILSWEGIDPEGESITYDIYLHQTEVYVQGYREEAIYEEEYDGTNITLSDLDPGKTYFWTVIPNDGCSDGLCTSGVMSFRVNYKPTFKTIEDQKISAVTNFKFKISCTDQDSEDLSNLRYSLAEAPDGMTISDETGMIRWTPKDNQVMLHTVTVEVTDGIETNTATFEIEVGKAESSSSSLFMIIIIAVVIILLALGIFLLFKMKKKMDEAARKKEEEERAALAKEKESSAPSYEDLYGIPAPEKDEEGLTTSELKDYIHEQIEDLEGKE